MRKSIHLDSRVTSTLEQLHREADRQEWKLVLGFLGDLPRFVVGKGVKWKPARAGFLKDKYIAIDREQGEFLYMLARMHSARSILEFGTSFGISTIYLAAAVRDNGGGKVYGTEFEPEKAKAARENLKAAGLSDYVNILEGDARQTLKDFDKSIDLALIDGYPIYNLEILKLIEKRLKKGAIVFSDDVKMFREDLKPYVDYVAGENSGYTSLELKINGGSLLAIKD